MPIRLKIGSRSPEAWQGTLVIMCFAQMVSMIGFSSIFPFLPLYVKSLGTVTSLSADLCTGLVFSGQAFSMMITGILYGNIVGTEVLLTGSPDNPVIQEMLEVLRAGYRPWTTISLYDPDSTALAPRWIQELSPENGGVAAYVCRNGTCSLPVTSSLELLELLDGEH